MNIEPVAVLYCVLIDELSSIVCNDYARDAISRDDILPYELTDLFICDGAKGLGFYILGEVIYGQDNKLSLSLCRRKGAKEIYTPFVEGQDGLNSLKVVRWLSSYFLVVLALGSTFDQYFSVAPKGGPVVSASKDLAYYSSYSLVYSAFTFVYFAKYIVSFFRGNTLQKGMCV